MSKQPFSIEQAITEWRSNLKRHQGLEPGHIEELESHLRDKIDDLREQGCSDEEAFLKSVENNFDNAEEIAEQFFQARKTKLIPPPWQNKSVLTALLPNFLKVVTRNFVRNKGYAFINIFGLAIGIAGCILILLYINDEYSYDDFHDNSEQVYRVLNDYKWGDQEALSYTSPPPLGRVFTQEIPGVKSSVRFYKPNAQILRNGEVYFKEDEIFAVDSTFLDVFSFNLIAGNPKNLWNQPYSMVITPEIAQKFFGEESALGKSLQLGDSEKFYTITGIIEAPPENSHIQFEVLTSIYTYGDVEYFEWSWVWNGVATYVVLQDGASELEVEKNIPAIVNANLPPTFNRIGFSFEELLDNGGHWKYELQPLKDIWLQSSSIGNPLGGSSNILYVYILGTAALLILIIACINFMNLATARSVNRGKEVGIRKTLGSSRRVLAWQFLTESLLYSLIASVMALVIIYFSIPGFNNLAAKNLSVDLIGQPWILVTLALITIFVGLIAGSYPALALSSFKPVDVLKGGFKASSKGKTLRHVLVVGQFSISLILIIGTLVVYSQLEYIQNKDLGFDKDQVLIVKNIEALDNQQQTFIDEISKIRGVSSVSLTSSYPSESDFTDFYHPKNSSGKDLMIGSVMTDDEFLETMGIEIIAGRNFRENSEANRRSVIINNKTATNLGWQPEEAVGEKLIYPGGNYQEFEVIGVMNDFNYYSLMNPVPNFAFFHYSSESYRASNNYGALKLSPDNVDQVLANLSGVWGSFITDVPFEYVFLDDQFASLYRSQERMGVVFGVFTIIALIIACMGLLGLVTFATEQRTKEIGIRKVLGASSSNIVLLLSKDFAKLILAAFLIASPIAYFLSQEWLNDFEYSITISPAVFIFSGVIILIVVFATTSFKSVKAALSNPIKSLRSE
jgi:putative ABC transport system permease protein